MAIVHFVNYKRGTQSRAAMRGVMLYVMQEKKTAWEDGPLVSGINCQPQSVYDDFLNTKLLYHKDGGVMFYHMVQSFPKGAAVDPWQAHEAARRLAEYFDGCEVLVCTHVDREHIHSHCVINSVNFDTGKKLHMAKEQLQELMRRNDAICLEMGLPVFEAAAQQARGMSGAEYHAALKGQSWKLRLMNTIDECMKYAAADDAAHRDPVRSAAGDEQTGGAGRRNKLGAGGNLEYVAGIENAHRPDAGAEVAHRDAEIADGNEQTAGTGWEFEREAFLQVDRLAPGFQPAGGPQVDCSTSGDRSGGTGRVVWRGSDPRPVPLIPAAAGLSAVGTLLDEDEDAEEKRRRTEAKIAAENFGAAIGFAAGAALAVKGKLDEHAAREGQKGNQHEQTMGGF